MLRSVEADEAASNPDAPVDVAMVTPKHLAVPCSSGPPVDLPALLPSSSQGTKPARIQMAVSSADAAYDGIVGPATATAPVLGEAVTGAGAVPAAPVAPAPEAISAVPVVRPQAVTISGAPETGASADISPAEASGVSAAGDSVASFGAAPGKDAATPSPPEINLPLPLGPTSIASATAAGGSTPLPRAVSAPTADEARTLSAVLTVSAVAASKAAVSTLNYSRPFHGGRNHHLMSARPFRRGPLRRHRRRRYPPCAFPQLRRQLRKELSRPQPLRRPQPWPLLLERLPFLLGHSTRSRPGLSRLRSLARRLSGVQPRCRRPSCRPSQRVVLGRRPEWRRRWTRQARLGRLWWTAGCLQRSRCQWRVLTYPKLCLHPRCAA
jgi:hypothetical protein